MRWTFQLALFDMMQRDERTFLLWGDVGAGLFKQHREKFPNRCLNVGVCEQATVSMAAGMAMQGFRPIVYTITPFLIERAFEQIKIDIDQMNLPVGIVGHSDGNSGPTHQELNAKAMVGLLTHVQGYFPSSDPELSEMMKSLNSDEPWFMALKTI
jgi:transketolase